MNGNKEPEVIGFLCNWCSYAAADAAGSGRHRYPTNIRIIRVPCSGRVDPFFILSALRCGAAAVLTAGCYPGNCHYSTGNLVARRRFAMLKNLLEFTGLEEGRINLTWMSAAEGVNFARVATGVAIKARELGPYRGALRKHSGVPDDE
ncbi:MAG: hydrogenase iron-sulfur subunit [Desulfotomaculales bacterium]